MKLGPHTPAVHLGKETETQRGHLLMVQLWLHSTGSKISPAPESPGGLWKAQLLGGPQSFSRSGGGGHSGSYISIQFSMLDAASSGTTLGELLPKTQAGSSE